MTSISVIIPVYNVEKYLEKCLDSVCNQTLSNIEIICVEANSSDNSYAILERYQKRYPKIKIIKSKEKLTAGSARNLGIDAATGEYLGFVDGDDFIDLDYYEKLYKKAIKTKADVVKANLSYVGWDVPSNIKYYNLAQVRENKVKFNHIPTCIIKKDFLNKNSIRFSSDLTCAEDGVFEVAFSLICNKIEIEDSVSYYYVYRNESLNHTEIVTLDKIKEIEKSVLKIIDLYNDFCSDEKVYIEGIIDRYKYLSFFVKNKKCDEDVKAYIKQAEKNFFSKLKYQEKIRKYEFNKRVEASWMAKLKDKQEAEKKKYIISLTSYPKRMKNIHYCLYSLLNQTKKPDMVILWLAEDEFLNPDKDIPAEVLRLCDFGLTIKFTKNIKSYKKLIPALEQYPNDNIITADDDIFYPKDWFERLYLQHQNDKEYILCHRAHKITFKNKNEVNLYKHWKKLTTDKRPSYLNFCTTGGGVLYPVGFLHNDVFREDLFMSLAPNADDIWFWAMSVLNNKEIKVIDKPYSKIDQNELFKNANRASESLYQQNIVFNDLQLKNIFNYYPELFEKIKRSK